MAPNWKKVESLTKPAEFDNTSTAAGIYVRQNIEKIIVTAENGEEIEKYTYFECLMTEGEYNNYILQKYIKTTVLDEDDTPEYQNYKNKLDEPIQYTNGFYYKPKWAEKVYLNLINIGTMFPFMFPKRIFDATDKYENSVEMTVEELKALAVFLANKQEEYFQEYKAARAMAKKED